MLLVLGQPDPIQPASYRTPLRACMHHVVHGRASSLGPSIVAYFSKSGGVGGFLFVFRNAPKISGSRYSFVRNGLLSRSSPIDVRGPWPGTTTVSSGNARTVSCRERRIFCVDPPGRSVRP